MWRSGRWIVRMLYKAYWILIIAIPNESGGDLHEQITSY